MSTTTTLFAATTNSTAMIGTSTAMLTNASLTFSCAGSGQATLVITQGTNTLIERQISWPSNDSVLKSPLFLGTMSGVFQATLKFKRTLNAKLLVYLTYDTQVATSNAVTFQRLQYDLPVWKASYFDALNGRARAKICHYGTSHAVGAGTGTGGTLGLTGAAKYRTGYLLAKIFKQRVGSGQNEGFCGLVGTGDSLMSAYDPRITALSTGVTTPVIGFGGYIGAFTNVNDALTFTPETAWDKLEVVCYCANYAASVKVTIGAQNTTLDLNVNTGYTAFVITAPSKAVQPFTLTCLSSPSLAFFDRANVYDSTALGIEVYSAGLIGAFASALAQDGSWNTIPGLKQLAPQLTIIDSMPNDILNAGSLATYKTSLASIVAAAKLSGDVIVRGTFPMNNANVTTTTYAAFLAAAHAVCDPLSINVIDPTVWFGTSYAQANASGLFYADGVHETARASLQDATWMYNLIVPTP